MPAADHVRDVKTTHVTQNMTTVRMDVVKAGSRVTLTVIVGIGVGRGV